MALFLVTFIVMALMVGAMAIGVLFGRAPIAGSCGGLNAIDGSGKCQACSRPCRVARRAQVREDSDAQALSDARRPVEHAALHDLRERRTR